MSILLMTFKIEKEKFKRRPSQERKVLMLKERGKRDKGPRKSPSGQMYTTIN